MPDSVFGREIRRIEHVADIVRLRVLYEEGGIYMDTDLVALRSSDTVLSDPSTKTTVMAEEAGVGLCNALIMSTPKAPFIRRWMDWYRSFEDQKWNDHSVILPYHMYPDRDPDITVLHDHAWFYPMYGRHNRGFRTMWLGKSWWDIDRSFGVHLWRGSRGPMASLLTPQTVRAIDTPLFCAMRKLFDDVDGDGIVSLSPATNPNCSVPRVSEVVRHQDGLFSVYEFDTDDIDAKWVDRLGNNLHGWAPVGTRRLSSGLDGSTDRYFAESSYAVLPVPLGWDPRARTTNVDFKFDTKTLAYGQEIVLVKTSIGENGAIVIKLIMGEEGQQHSFVEFAWISKYMSWATKTDSDDLAIKFPIGFWQLSNGDWHNLTVSYDRKTVGTVDVSINSTLLRRVVVQRVSTKPTAYEIWVGSQDESHKGPRFQRTIRQLRFFSRAVGPSRQSKKSSGNNSTG